MANAAATSLNYKTSLQHDATPKEQISPLVFGEILFVVVIFMWAFFSLINRIGKKKEDDE